MLQITRIAPVQAKDLCKNTAMLRPVHETGMQRPVKVATFRETRRFNRANGINYPPRPDRQPGPPQSPRKMRNVSRKPRVLWQVERQILSHRPSRGLK